MNCCFGFLRKLFLRERGRWNGNAGLPFPCFHVRERESAPRTFVYMHKRNQTYVYNNFGDLNIEYCTSKLDQLQLKMLNDSSTTSMDHSLVSDFRSPYLNGEAALDNAST